MANRKKDVDSVPAVVRESVVGNQPDKGKEKAMLNLVTVRARTRGKGPKEFTYQGIGRLTERQVTNKDGFPIRTDGKELEFTETPAVDENGKPIMETVKVITDGVETEVKRQVINRAVKEGQEFIVVDDINPAGITDNLSEVTKLMATFATDKVSAAQLVIDGALNYYNEIARDKASPAPEEKEDVLGPLVKELVSAGLLISSDDRKKDTVGMWRRNVTIGANSVEEEPLVYAEMTKEVKKLRKMLAAK